MNNFITADIFAALNIAVMEQTDDGSFHIVGSVPDWLTHFYPDATSHGYELMLDQHFPFLENFLIDAQNFWSGNNIGSLKSGLWNEVDIFGNNCYLEASAIKVKDKSILLISLGEIGTYEEKYSLIQKARENSLSHHHLVKEAQKKEILIHCIVHDLAGQLTGIKYSFELMGLQDLSPKAQQYLEIGKKQAKNQEILIREMLDAFAAEVESLKTFTLDPAIAPDALTCLKDTMKALFPNFFLNKVDLQLDPNIEELLDWKVVGEKSRLNRVLFNLIENALRHSPRNSTVTVGIENQNQFILFYVNDQGAGIPQEISKNLFDKFSQGKDKFGRAGLGLYFCRITVELWGGTIGCSSRSSGGAHFWFRLPKAGLS